MLRWRNRSRRCHREAGACSRGCSGQRTGVASALILLLALVPVIATLAGQTFYLTLVGSALREAIDRELIPAMRAFPGARNARALWPQRREDEPPLIFCQVLVEFDGPEDMQRMLGNASACEMKGDDVVASVRNAEAALAAQQTQDAGCAVRMP